MLSAVGPMQLILLSLYYLLHNCANNVYYHFIIEHFMARYHTTNTHAL